MKESDCDLVRKNERPSGGQGEVLQRTLNRRALQCQANSKRQVHGLSSEDQIMGKPSNPMLIPDPRS